MRFFSMDDTKWYSVIKKDEIIGITPQKKGFKPGDTVQYGQYKCAIFFAEGVATIDDYEEDLDHIEFDIFYIRHLA